METYSLTEDQRQQAKDLYHRVDSGEISSPTDFVSEWTKPDLVPEYSPDRGPYPEHYGFIDPTKIKGTYPETIHRFEPGRIKTHLARFYRGKFQRQHTAPPKLQKIQGEYYVTDDGVHRSLTARGLGLNELYVYYTVPPGDLLKEPPQ